METNTSGVLDKSKFPTIAEPANSTTVTSIDDKVRKDVVKFLRDLATRLESDTLSPEASLQISEFYMKYNFINDLFENIQTLETGKVSNNDILKFMSLGWYVYNHLLPHDKGVEEKRE